MSGRIVSSLALFLVAALAFATAAPAQTLTAAAPGKEITSAMGDLSPELRERAKTLGYAESDTVRLNLAPSGQLVVLPKVQKAETPDEMKQHLFTLVQEKVVRSLTAETKFQFVMDTETGEVTAFEVHAPFRSLLKPLQADAKAKGYAKSDAVVIRVNPVDWTFVVDPKPAKSVPFTLEEIIPGKTPEDQPTIRGFAPFDELYPVDKAAAKNFGYRSGEDVHVEIPPGAKEFTILSRPFRIGLRQKFDDMKKPDQDEAARLGYKPGDTVWSEFSPAGVTTRPAAEVGEGPWAEVIGAEIRMQAGGTAAIMPICLVKFDRLKGGNRLNEAIALGYKDGDTVGLQWDSVSGVFTVLKPGQAESMAAH